MIDPSNIEYFLNLGLTGLFYVTTLVFVIFSLSIVYHWFSYGVEKARTLVMLAIYLSVSAALFISMSLALTAF